MNGNITTFCNYMYLYNWNNQLNLVYIFQSIIVCSILHDTIIYIWTLFTAYPPSGIARLNKLVGHNLVCWLFYEYLTVLLEYIDLEWQGTAKQIQQTFALPGLPLTMPLLPPHTITCGIQCILSCTYVCIKWWLVNTQHFTVNGCNYCNSYFICYWLVSVKMMIDYQLTSFH